MTSNIQGQLEALARSGQWHDYISLATQSGATDVETAIEALFCLFRILVYPDSDFVSGHEDAMEALKELFLKYLERYSDSARFLFFAGYFMALSEWAFGEADFERSHRMLKRASAIEPGNILYEWGYKFSTGDPESCKLTQQLYQSESIMNGLRNQGKGGVLIAEAVETAYQRCT